MQTDLQRLMDVREISVPRVTHAAGHRAVSGDGVFQQIPHHGGRAPLRQALQLLIDGTVGVHAVVVVGIDDAERLVDEFPGTQHRVGGTEGLGAPLRYPVERRHGGEILKGVAHLHRLALRRPQTRGHVAAQPLHQLQHIRLDDEHDLIETGPHRVVDAVLHEDLSVRTHAVRLLIAAIAGAQARRHND